MLAVWATQSPFLEQNLVQSAKHCCLQERLSNSVFCSTMLLLCTPLKYDHIPYLISLLIFGTPFPSQNKLNRCVTVARDLTTSTKNGLSTNFLCIIICHCYIGSFMPVLHLVWIMPSYSRKTINRMHTKINIGNFWLHCDVMLFMLKLKCLVAQLHLGL